MHFRQRQTDRRTDRRTLTWRHVYITSRAKNRQKQNLILDQGDRQRDKIFIPALILPQSAGTADRRHDDR